MTEESRFVACKRYYDWLETQKPDMHHDLLALGMGVLLGEGYVGAAAAVALAWKHLYPGVPLPNVMQAIIEGREPQFQYFPGLNQ